MGQSFGDGEQAVAVEEGCEDLFHHGRGGGIEFQPVGTLAVGGLGRVGVWTRVGQPVAVRWPTSQEAALHLGLGGHGGAHTDLDAVALAFAHSAEHAHDQVMSLVGRIDRAAHLRHPERDPEVLEDGEGQAVLVAIEGPVWFTDHHCVEAAIRVAQCGEQRRRVRAALPGDRTGLVDVEELGDDHAPARLDERAGAGDLPGPRGLGVLVVLSGDPAVEGEGDGVHGFLTRHSDGWPACLGEPLTAGRAVRRLRRASGAAVRWERQRAESIGYGCWMRS
ncbi:hypothetical protein OUY24_04230 [Nonomuraea ferruginea]|uniref:Uncharacterized protein n=1 Tax=Nonomuraea ferruginea TaxID=46174 RepID=A0ABT4SRM4_9ACTN|nr:hypothetical protein [Nonomuraea ferruginea]MDA0639817.1 hypothetical protein [Nonomuraea ferruginea]